MVPDESFKQAERKERQISIMLIAIVLVFLSCNTLAFVVNILENVGYDNALYVSLVTYNNFLASDFRSFFFRPQKLFIIYAISFNLH